MGSEATWARSIVSQLGIKIGRSKSSCIVYHPEGPMHREDTKVAERYNSQ